MVGNLVEINELLQEHPEWVRMKWRWKKMRLMLAGEDKVKEWDVETSKGAPKIDTFILRPPGQGNDQYNYMVYNTRYFNVVARTAEILIGLLFYRDPTAVCPPKMAGYLANIDLAGSSVAEFAKRVAHEAITIGRGGLFLDYPHVLDGEERTVSEAEKQNLRPFAKYLTAEQVYNWDYTVINNVRTLTQVFIDESYDSSITTERSLIRELSLVNLDGKWVYKNTLYQKASNKEIKRTSIQQRGMKKSVKGTILSETFPTQIDGSYFSEIPFWFVGPQFDQYRVQKAPMSDVADLSVEHYRKCSEISSALFHCAHPTPVFCGFTFGPGEDIILGARTGISTTQADAHASYLELNGQSITEIRKERDSVTVELASLGARLLTGASDANQTAETSRIKASGETSVMNTLTSTLDQIFTKMLEVMAIWQGEDSAQVNMAFNKEFMPYRLGANDINALVAAVTADKLPMEDFLEIMQTGGIIRQSRTLEDYNEALSEQIQANIDLNKKKGLGPDGKAIPPAPVVAAPGETKKPAEDPKN